MRLDVDGSEIFVGTGGRDFDPALPAVVFLHGAGMDHTVWALLARAFAHHGFAVLAPDLPGHGHSAGEALSSIAALADWTAALIDAAGVGAARLVGHSMGSLVALETAARHPEKVTALALISTAAPMRVSDDLLNAAKANDHAAVDMISLWGNGYHATLGGSLAPGLWMLGETERLLERAHPGVHLRRSLRLQQLSGRARRSREDCGSVPRDPRQPRYDDCGQGRQSDCRRHRGLPRQHDRRRRSHADERTPRRRARRAAGVIVRRRLRRVPLYARPPICSTIRGARTTNRQGMIRKSGSRFSEKIMLRQGIQSETY